VKTHRGVNTEWHRLVKDDTRIDDELRAFLGFAYNLKAIADYETGPAQKCRGVGGRGGSDEQALRREDG
jgi:uncharacterized protein (UPF0332 family)